MTPAADFPLESQFHDDDPTEFIDIPEVRSTLREHILTMIASVWTGLNALVDEKPLFMERNRDCRWFSKGPGSRENTPGISKT